MARNIHQILDDVQLFVGKQNVADQKLGPPPSPKRTDAFYLAGTGSPCSVAVLSPHLGGVSLGATQLIVAQFAVARKRTQWRRSAHAVQAHTSFLCGAIQLHFSPNASSRLGSTQAGGQCA